MSEKIETLMPIIRKAAERYAETTTLRAAVQAIPFIGGSLDALIGGEGQKIQQRRVAHFISELDARLRKIEDPRSELSEEDLFDLMLATFERVAKARSESKRIRFAQVISKQVAAGGTINDAETAIRLIGELEDIHIAVLNTALHAPLAPSPFDGLRIVTIARSPVFGTDGSTPPKLQDVFANYPESMLRLVCSELVAKGLLRDEGIGRWDTKGMEYFVPTELAGWLYTWIRNG